MSRLHAGRAGGSEGSMHSSGAYAPFQRQRTFKSDPARSVASEPLDADPINAAFAAVAAAAGPEPSGAPLLDLSGETPRAANGQAPLLDIGDDGAAAGGAATPEVPSSIWRICSCHTATSTAQRAPTENSHARM